MLSSLYIKNYALIDELNVQFNNGLSIITGETGAGKSILLGGLALVLGKRADLSQIKTKSEKCVIEATFDVANYNLKALFKTLDFDYDAQTIVRREILPSGKSRAFVNDSPVTLDGLTQLSTHLIDIHSQHQTQRLTDDTFHFQVIDALANNSELLEIYSAALSKFNAVKKTLNELKSSKTDLIKEYDYNSFLLKELTESDLEDINLEEWEHQFETLSNVEDIKEKLTWIQTILITDERGTIDQLQGLKQHLSSISNFGRAFATLLDRIESVTIELKDISSEIDMLESDLSTDPKELESITSKLQNINNLLLKHGVSKIEDLITIRRELLEKVSQTDNLDSLIDEKNKELLALQAELKQMSQKISKRRTHVIPDLVNKLESILNELGMPNARFKILLEDTGVLNSKGVDELSVMFAGNKGSDFKLLKNSASGGERSRIMLAIKSVLAEYMQLPSIMFDEIDTGVSGEIAHKMGAIMKKMSSKMQVFTITHLPQIAAKGSSHYKVFKTIEAEQTKTNLKKLGEEDRLVEIAQMLGGNELTESAMAHAKQLLN